MVQLSIRRVLLVVGLMATLGCAAQRNKKSKVANANAGELLWSNYRGSFTQFIQQAIRQNAVAIVDKDVTPPEPVTIEGNLTLKGTGITIYNQHKQLFVVGSGVHHFSHFTVQQSHAEGSAFLSNTQPKLVWTNTLDDVHINGGQYGYNSSRGGLYDEKQDSVLAWSGTTILNSTFNVRYIAIAVFSQDGPCKYLHMRNVQMSTSESHNLYIHPNVSMRFDSVASIKAGKLAMHHFSGGNEQFYYTARYLEMNRVTAPSKAAWEMINPKSGYIMINNSNMGPYTAVGANTPWVYATNSTFYNAGNGVMLSGKLINCSGKAWSGGKQPLAIEGGNYSEICFRPGGTIKASKANITYLLLSDRGNAFEGEFDNCTISEIQDSNTDKGRIVLRKTTVKNNRSSRPKMFVIQ